MKIMDTSIQGVYIIDIDRLEDERGFFARSVCENEFKAHGMQSHFVQCSISFSPHQGTLRGMHYQVKPHEEVKLVRCTRGAIFDVIVDLRESSDTFCRWVSVELTQDNRRSIYVPFGCAHGFLTLVPDTEVSYQISESFDPASARGVRFDDPAFGIEWPYSATKLISPKDKLYQDFKHG